MSENEQDNGTDSEYEDYEEEKNDIETSDMENNKGDIEKLKKSEKNKIKYGIIAKCFNNVSTLAKLARKEEIPVSDLKKNLKRNKVYHEEARKIAEKIKKEVGKDHFDKETLVSIKKILAAKKRSYSENYGGIRTMISYGGPYAKKRYGSFLGKLMRDRDRAEHATMVVNEI
jgi:LysM repeat protein